MFPEKEIVGLWLNSQGYLVINDINAGKNKVADALALKLEKGELKEAVHVEVYVSVAGAADNLAECKAKFSDPLVKRAIHLFVKRFCGKPAYSKMLVVNSPGKEKLGDIKVVPFEAVLAEVIAGLDKQNYAHPTVRTLQLLKYLMLFNSEGLTQLLSQNALSKPAMHKLIESVLGVPETQRVFAKSKNKARVEASVAGSALAKPKPMAQFIINNFTTRSFNQFLKELFKHEKAKRFTKKTSPKQRSLNVYLD